ncbi:protein suppressor of variegation 3-7 [Drosophila miranda]|uniref:protein suppressor of variegation 3-7 n=1 Tax=Drosophila miranda TaxID=7229 RepID=UPI0007E874D5|nr:protein suppressor of variegation 3-7 [Drosophila miranda]
MWNSHITIKNEENILEEAYTIAEADVKPDLTKQPRIQRFAMPLKRQFLPYMKPAPQNREELLQSITHNREQLAAFFQNVSPVSAFCQRRQTDCTVAAVPTSISEPPAPVQQRNSYDLFFESACISVKGLPPKLAAEAKSRISQIITEFEIRAISEEEAKVEAQTRAAIGARDPSHARTVGGELSVRKRSAMFHTSE